MPNKLSQFWQELKRRKVTRVITVYAAAAFVILELTDIVAPSLGLPSWTLNLIIFLLCVGFIIAAILSWIYDIHPEEGIVKTEPAHKVKVEEIPKSSNSWKIATYISFVVIVGLIVFNKVSSSNRSNLETSIAVLPFDNMSVGEDYSHMGDAITGEIILELQKIKDFDRVLSRTSTMQYKENRPTIPEIAEKLKVNYIIEGSIQRRKENLSIRVQVIRAKHEDHVWADEYDGKWEDIHTIQDEIAFTIAHELKTVLSPEEKQLIEKIPTTDLTALDFYQRGREEHWKYTIDNDNKEALERAEDLYHDALEYDSAFALAYTGLARVYWDKNYWETYFSENFLDSVLILADIAISHDNQIAEAYTVRGDYYRQIGQTEQAIKEYDRAIRINQNSWMAYASKGGLYWSIGYVKAIENLHKAASLNRGSELPTLLGSLWNSYYYAGFREEGLNYLLEKLKLDGDSVDYFYYLSWDALHNNEFAKGIEFGKKALGIDSSDFATQKILGLNYSFLGQYEQSLKYLKKSIGSRDTLGAFQINYMQRLGYAYWQNGSEEEADYYFDKQIDYCNWAIELGRTYSKVFGSYYDLAGVYAFRGEKDRAYENLRIVNQKQWIHFGVLYWFKKDPLFEHIRNEPEFQQIVKEVEARHLAEHERVRKWLEENDML